MCNACLPRYNAEQSAAFGEQLAGYYNHAATVLMISIGHRTGLFDSMSEMSPATSDEIASKAGLNERYVREWLGVMTTARIVNYDPILERYHLPEEHAVLLTRAAAPNNMAVTACFIPVLASVESEIVECFTKGGGVPYDQYARFHEVMAEDSNQTVVLPLLDQLLPLDPELGVRLGRGARVLDLGCGRGKALIKMAESFPNSEFVGYDLCEETIANARWNSRHLNNLRFEKRDAATLDEEECYDVVFTFDSVHDQADPGAMLRNIHRLLKQDGIYFMQDIAGSSDLQKNLDHPFAPLVYTISCMHCMSVSLSQQGAGLGAMWGEELAEKMVREAGFSRFEKRNLEHDILNNFYLIRK